MAGTDDFTDQELLDALVDRGVLERKHYYSSEDFGKVALECECHGRQYLGIETVVLCHEAKTVAAEGVNARVKYETKGQP